MTEQNIVSVVLMLPVVQGIEIPVDQKRDALRALMPGALDEVVMAYDWRFAIDKATESSVADQADYTLEGNNGDCRDIINVKYDGDLLTKMRQVAWDEYITDRTHTGVNTWIPTAPVNGFPTITIKATPSTADEDITYRYRRKNVPIQDFPDEFGFVLVSALTKRIVPEYTAVYDNDLEEMINRYAYGGGESDQIKQDPKVVAKNNRRSRLMGFGG